MAYSAGTAFLEVMPSFKNVESMIAKGARDLTKGLDKALGKQLAEATDRATKNAERDTARSGSVLGKTFADGMLRHVRSALASIPQTDRVLKPLRQELQALSEVDLGKGFNEKDFIARIEKVQAALRRAQQDAAGPNMVGRFANAGNAAQELGAVKDIAEAARRRGFVAGDAYSDAYLSRLKAMDRALPDLLTRSGSSPEQREVAAIKQRIQDAMKLAIGDVVRGDDNPLNLKIGTKISGEDLAREMGSLEGLLDQFTERSGTVELQLATDKARAQAGGFFDDIKTQEQRATEKAAEDYLKTWDAALAERSRREAKARELAAAEERKQLEDGRRLREQHLRELARVEEQNRALRLKQERAGAEQRARELKRARDGEAADFAAAIAEDYKRDKQARDRIANDHASAIAEDYKRQLKAQRDFQRDYDAALLEDLKRQRRLQDDFLKDWDRALSEARRRQQQAAEELARAQAKSRGQTTVGEAQDKLGAARDRIADIPVHLQANAIDREMAAIRERIERLGNVEIGVDIDVESFADQVQAEFARLRAISRNNKIDMEVRVDAARAATELGGILTLVNRIDGKKAEVKVDADSAAAGLKTLLQSVSLNLGRLGALVAIGSSIGTAIVPAAAAAASAIGALGTAALAAGSGVGVLMLGFSGIGDAVKAMGQLEDSQQKSANSTAQAGRQVQSALEQLKSAEMSLAEVRHDNAAAAVRAQREIKDALLDQKEAIQDVARANEEATLRVADAQRDLKDALENVRRSNEDAALRVADAQRSLTRSTEDELLAREKLSDAYVQAKRVLDDLFASIRGNSLDQRQATLDIARAKADLDKLIANPRATAAEREQARITYEQRLLQMDNLKRAATELEDEQQKRWTQGIDKVEEVVAARRGLLRADEERAAAARALARAEKDQERARLDGSRQITAAQRAVSKAITDQQRAQQDGIRKVAAAQRAVDDARLAASEQQRNATNAEARAVQAVAAAQRSLASASDKSATAGGAQLDNLTNAMAKLSPTAQKFARYIFGLRDAFYALRDAASPMLAGLQTAMQDMIGKTSGEAQKKLAPLFDFVSRVATALGQIFIRIGDLLKGPTFTRFFGYISDTAVPTLQLMYEAFENITVGVLNLFLGFTPLTDDVNQGFLGMTKSFRDWSETLEQNQGFQDFIAYLRDSGPQVARFLGGLAKTVWDLVVAAAPIGTVVLKAFTWLFQLINKIPQDVLTALVAGIAAAAGALAIFAGVTSLLSLSIAGLIAGAIALLVVAFSAVAGSSRSMQQVLLGAWNAIKAGAVIAFKVVKDAIVALKPVWDDMVEAALSFYNDGLKPLWDSVVALFGSLISAIRPYFDDIGGFFAQLGKLAFYLYDQAILPAFKGIMVVVRTLLEVFKPVFETIGTIIGTVAGVIFWLLNRVVMPVVTGIVALLVKTLGPAVRFLWTYFVKPALASIGLAFQIAKAIIQVAIGLITLAIKAMGAIFKWLYVNAIKPVWDDLVENVFRPMGDWIQKHIKPSWDKGVAALGKTWENFKKLIGTPIKFIVETLLNDGLLKGYNWLADKFNIEPKNVRIPAPKGGWTGFRAGGAVNGRGTGTSDSIPARLSRGEHVLTAKEVQAAGGHDMIYALRRAILAGQLGIPRFAKGGEVGFGDWLTGLGKSLKDKSVKLWDKGKEIFGDVAAFMANPAKSLKTLFDALLAKLPNSTSPIVQDIVNVPRKVLGGLVDKVKDLIGIGGGATGSGVAGQWPSSPMAQRGDSGVWHQVIAVIKGSGIKSGSFGNSYRPGDPLWHGSGRAVDWMGFNQDALATYLAARKPLELIHRTNSRDYAYTRGKNKGSFNQSLMQAHRNHIHIAFDNGGLLPDTRNMPGGVMQVFHGRRTPDKVLTDTQWQQMAALAEQARQSIGGGDTYNFPYRNSTLDYDELQRWSARREALTRVGRPNY